VSQITISKGLTNEEAETLGLVLLSSGIVHKSEKSKNGWEISVHQESAVEAEILIRKYRAENSIVSAEPDRFFYDYTKSLSGVWAALLLAAVHIVVYTRVDHHLVKGICAASAGRILNGELYRAAAALMLHADIVHLTGNMVGIAILGSAVCSIMGWGTGWLAVLSSGIAGNLMNAYFYKAGHSSIGASTAVFGALGILTAWQFLRRARQPGQRLKALLPLGAGLALLGFMGSSMHTDILAHLFGFLSGIVVGGLYGSTINRQPGVAMQTGSLIITAVILLRVCLSVAARYAG